MVTGSFSTITSQLPAVARFIVELATPVYAVRPLLQTVPFPTGKTFVVYKQKGARAVGVTKTAEGAYVTYDFRDYDIVTYEPPIFTEGIEISQATLDTFEGVIDIWGNQLNALARRIVTQHEAQTINALSSMAGDTFPATGKSLGFHGTEFTIANSPGTLDILTAMKKISVNNLIPEYILLNPVQVAQLSYLPHYTSYGYTGSVSPTTNGVVGEVQGLRVIQTTMIPAGKGYVVSTGRNGSGAYEPLGFWVEKSPLMAFRNFDSKRAMHVIDTYYHAGPLITSSACIVEITGMATS
jgi:hypothetical protein